MMGRVFMAKGEYAKAVESLQRVISQDRELVSETLEMLQTCYQQLGKTAEWAEFLQRAVEERNTGADAELMLLISSKRATVVRPHRSILRASFSVIRPCVCSIS